VERVIKKNRPNSPHISGIPAADNFTGVDIKYKSTRVPGGMRFAKINKRQRNRCGIPTVGTKISEFAGAEAKY
jgi:hypothetical protein